MKGILLSFFTLLLLSGNAYAIETGSDLLQACEAFERNATISSDGEPRHSASTEDMLPGVQTSFFRWLAAKRSRASLFSRSSCSFVVRA